MEILCYALSAAVLVLTGAVISGGVVLPRRLPKRAHGRIYAGGYAQPRSGGADELRTRGGQR